MGALLRAETEILEIYYFDPLNHYTDISLEFDSNETVRTPSNFDVEAMTINELNLIKFTTTAFDDTKTQLKLTYYILEADVLVKQEKIIKFKLNDMYKRKHIYTYYVRNDRLFQSFDELANDITYATFDIRPLSHTVVSFKVKHPVPDVTKITLTSNNQPLPINDIRLHGDTYFFNTDEIDYKDEYVLSIDFLEKDIKSYYVRYDWLYEDGSFTSKYNYGGDDLGASYTESHTTFKLWAPLLKEVTLNIYTDGVKESYPMLEGSFGVFQTRVLQNLKNREYTYSFNRFGKTHEIIDPNATYINDTNTRGVIVNPSETLPKGFKETELTFSGTYVDAFIYETSIKQMTGDKNVNGYYANTFYALSRPNTTLQSNKNIKTGLNHLVDLGITHITLNDIFDTTYSLRAANNAYRIQLNKTPKTMSELKSLVQAFNNYDIGVIYDLNLHQPVIDALELLMPGYYYEHHDGNVIKIDNNATFNTNHYMANHYIKSSIDYLVNDYHLSGIKLSPLNHMKLDDINILYQSLKQLNASFIMYGEFGPDALSKSQKVSPATLRNVSLIGVIDKRFPMDSLFFSKGDQNLRPYLLKDDRSTYQTATINQTFNRLPDLSQFNERQQRQAMYLNLLSFGVPVIKAGEEFNYRGDILSYEHDELSYLFYEEVRDLIRFRQSQPALKLQEHSDVKAKVMYEETDDTISLFIYDKDNPYLELFIVYHNNNIINNEIILPKGLFPIEKRENNIGPLHWRVLFSNIDGFKDNIYQSEETIALNRYHSMILHFGINKEKPPDTDPRVPIKPQENSNIWLMSMIFIGLGMVVGGMVLTYFIIKSPEEK